MTVTTKYVLPAARTSSQRKAHGGAGVETNRMYAMCVFEGVGFGMVENSGSVVRLF